MPRPRPSPSPPPFTLDAPTRIAASVAVVEDAHILLVREAPGSDAGGWNLPGGKVGPGESPLDAAIREAKEESGYRVQIYALAGAYHYLNRNGRPRLRYVFCADIASGKPACDGREITGVRWFGLSQARALPDADLAKPLLFHRILDDLARTRRHHPLDALNDIQPIPISI